MDSMHFLGQEQTEGSIRTLDADHEHNCCIPSVCSPWTRISGFKFRRPP